MNPSAVGESMVVLGSGWRTVIVIGLLVAPSGCATTSSYTNEPWIPDERFPADARPNPRIPVMNYQPPPVPNRP
jgi:hypothetical protein